MRIGIWFRGDHCYRREYVENGEEVSGSKHSVIKSSEEYFCFLEIYNNIYNKI